MDSAILVALLSLLGTLAGELFVAGVDIAKVANHRIEDLEGAMQHVG